MNPLNNRTMYRYTGERRTITFAGKEVELIPGRLISKKLYDYLPESQTIKQVRD